MSDTYTQQATFDAVWRGLEGQGWQQSTGRYVSPITGERYWGCRYRGVAGRRCAVGHLISDEDYDETLEGGSVSSAPLRERLAGHSGVLVCALQRAHDDNADPSSMRRAVLEIADRYGLSVPGKEDES